jgi:predicted DNA-binding transcriptional regulator AlpA
MGDLIIGPWQPTARPNLSKLQLAQVLGKSRKTIERYMASGMPHERTREGYARFSLSTVEAWLDERKAS